MVFLVLLLFTLPYVNSLRKTEKSKLSSYFQIKDSLFENKSADLIKNLEKKNGFKNLFLGTSFDNYNFNPKEWSISKYYNNDVIHCTIKFDNEISINGVVLKEVKLIFFEKELISIHVQSKLSKIKQNETGLLKALTNLYGESNLNKPINFRGRDKWNNEKELIFKPYIRRPYLNNHNVFSEEPAIVNMEPITSYLDNETSMYFRYKSQTINEYYWKSNMVYLEYLNNCIVKQYDPNMKESGIPTDNNNFLFVESTEFFAISQVEALANYYIFLETEKNKIKETNKLNQQKKINAESNKL